MLRRWAFAHVLSLRAAMLLTISRSLAAGNIRRARRWRRIEAAFAAATRGIEVRHER